MSYEIACRLGVATAAALLFPLVVVRAQPAGTANTHAKTEITEIDFKMVADLQNAPVAEQQSKYFDQQDASNPYQNVWTQVCLPADHPNAVLDQRMSVSSSDTSKPPIVVYTENSLDPNKRPMTLADMQGIQLAPSVSPRCLSFYPRFASPWPAARFNYYYVLYGLDWQSNQVVDERQDSTKRDIPFQTRALNANAHLPSIPYLPPPRNPKPMWTVKLKDSATGTSIVLTEAAPKLGKFNSYPLCSPDGTNCTLKIDRIE